MPPCNDTNWLADEPKILVESNCRKMFVGAGRARPEADALWIKWTSDSVTERHGVARDCSSAASTDRELPMTIHFLPPMLDRYDMAVEEAIATCDGNLHGALKALIVANEYLEKELEKSKRIRAVMEK
jgi:hypothetical protein